MLALNQIRWSGDTDGITGLCSAVLSTGTGWGGGLAGPGARRFSRAATCRARLSMAALRARTSAASGMVDTAAVVRASAGSGRLLPGSSPRDGSSRLLRGDTRRRSARQISQSTHAAKKRASSAAGRLSNMVAVILMRAHEGIRQCHSNAHRSGAGPPGHHNEMRAWAAHRVYRFPTKGR